MNEQAASVITVWAKAYTPAGYQVGITIPMVNGGLMAAIAFDAMLTDAGYLLNPAGVEKGEQSETFTHIVRRAKTSKEGGVSILIDFYKPTGEFSDIKMYLNNDDDVRVFTSVSGVDPRRLPLFDSDAALKRGSNPERDVRYITTLPAPVRVAWKEDANWVKPADGSIPKKPKYFDVRLVDAPAASLPAVVPTVTTPASAPAPAANVITMNDVVAGGDKTPLVVKPTQPEWKVWVAEMSQNGWATRDLLGLLKVERLGEFNGTLADATKIVTDYNARKAS
jgi:hypothetical protein